MPLLITICLSDILPGNTWNMNVNPPPRAIPTKALTVVVWLLYSEYIILCRHKDEGTAILNSTQSIIHRTFGNFVFMDNGIVSCTFSQLGQIETEPNLMYIKLIQVIIVLLTVPSDEQNKNVKSNAEGQNFCAGE